MRRVVEGVKEPNRSVRFFVTTTKPFFRFQIKFLGPLDMSGYSVKIPICFVFVLLVTSIKPYVNKNGILGFQNKEGTKAANVHFSGCFVFSKTMYKFISLLRVLARQYWS